MKTLKFISALFLVMLFMNGCLYNFILPEAEISTDPDDPDTPEVSFSADIVPIFNKCTACHKTGNTNPDLTPTNAYASITTTKYINSSTPEESLIYLVPHPNGNGHTEQYTTNQANLLLLWIKQGAQQN